MELFFGFKAVVVEVEVKVKVKAAI